MMMRCVALLDSPKEMEWNGKFGVRRALGGGDDELKKNVYFLFLSSSIISSRKVHLQLQMKTIQIRPRSFEPGMECCSATRRDMTRQHHITSHHNRTRDNEQVNL